ncbi:hypothetical protein JOF56_010792 [Kibdelosporangium banguiense]|uniref:Carboxypeptidase regulatory-like domain-containing protein n=1 Tax=Kibdelosporangium banguiense TaxID=1365924 RepID=A0ABS4U175_9PSEU|nr:carboxypeptidase regulatory-like domain-containing protein [Kibdelosporangium banguiense]MBP2330407.1 hypothetical protein [Kibdelosporangium banguiense]
MSPFMPLERSTLASPAWFVPFDDFTRRVRSAGVKIQLDRLDDDVWSPLDIEAIRTPSGCFAYPGLGRPDGPRYRARFTATGYQPLYPADGEPFSADVIGVQFQVPPPAVATQPRLVRLLPGVSFPYAPGIRTVHGFVRRPGTTTPVANALVEARGQTFHDRVPWLERTLTDPTGAFRLALRWDGERTDEETFRLQATERPGRAGELVVRLPRDAGRSQVIEIPEQ